MAYIYNTSIPFLETASSTTPEDVINDSGDLLLSIIAADGVDKSYTVPTGYTEFIDTLTGGVNLNVFWKISAATNEGSATFTHAQAADQIIGVNLAIKDVPASAVIDQSTTAAMGSVSEATFPTVTTTVDNCLIIYVAVSNEEKGMKINGLHSVASFYNAELSIDIAYGYQKTAGTTYAPKAVGHTSSYDGTLAVIAIKSDTGIMPPIGVDDAYTVINQLNDYDSDWSDGTSQTDPNTDTPAVTTFTDGTYSFAASHQIADYSLLGSINGFPGGDMLIAGGAEAARHSTLPLKSAIDLDTGGKLIHLTYTSNVDQPPKTKEIPFMVGLRSNAGAALRRWGLSGFDGVPNSFKNFAAVVIDPGDSSLATDDVGTYVGTDIDGAYIGHHRAAPTSQNAGDWSMLYALETVKISGGSITLPITFNSFADLTTSNGIKTMFQQEGSGEGQVVTMQPIQIGDGSGNTYCEIVGESLTTPGTANPNLNELFAFVGEDKFGLTLYGVSGDTIKIEKSVISFGVKGYIMYHASSTSAATWSHSGTIYKNAVVTLRDIGTSAYSGLLLTECDEVIHNDANLDGVTFDACQDTQAITITGSTQAALQTAIDRLTDTTFTNSSTYGLTISFTGTGDVSLNAPTGITVDELLYTSTNSSALTIVIGASGASFPSTSTGGSATSVTISNDKTFTVNMVDENGTAVTGAELTIVDTGTQSEQHHVESSVTGTEAFTFTAPLGNNVDIFIHKPGYDRAAELNRDLGSDNSSATYILNTVAPDGYEE